MIMKYEVGQILRFDIHQQNKIVEGSFVEKIDAIIKIRTTRDDVAPSLIGKEQTVHESHLIK